MKMVTLTILVPDSQAELAATLLRDNFQSKDGPSVGSVFEDHRIEAKPNCTTQLTTVDSEVHAIYDSLGSEYTRVDILSGEDPLVIYSGISKVAVSKLRKMNWKSRLVARHFAEPKLR